jgi:hypothetical protein
MIERVIFRQVMRRRLLITTCRGYVSVKHCLRCATPVQPAAKIQLLDFRGDRPAPRADRPARRLPVCWVRPRHFSELMDGPCRQRLQPSSGFKPRRSCWFLAARKTKAMRALHRMAFAGTVPLLAKIPSPRIKLRTSKNVPAPPAPIVGHAALCARGQRTDLRCTQAQLLAAACDTLARRANHLKPVQPLP